LILVRRNPQNTDLKINDAVIKEAFDNLRIDFDSRLGKADYVTLETPPIKISSLNIPLDKDFWIYCMAYTFSNIVIPNFGMMSIPLSQN